MKVLSDKQKKDFRKLLMLLADFGNPIPKEDWKSMVFIMKKILSLFETEPNEDVIKFGKWTEDQEKSNENNDEKNYCQIIMYIVTKRQNVRLIWNLEVSILLKEEHI